MIEGIKIAGFKSFRNETAVDFAPLTLLMGENSQGKSSILQAALLLYQSLGITRSYLDSESFLDFDGPAVDLGGFGAAVHNHDPGGVMEFTFTFKQTQRFGLRSKTVSPFAGKRVSVTIQVGAKESIGGALKGCEITLDDHVIRMNRQEKNRINSIYAAERDDVQLMLNLWLAARNSSEEELSAVSELTDDDHAKMSIWLQKTPMAGGLLIPCWDQEEISSGRPGRPVGGSLDSARRVALERFLLDWQSWCYSLDTEISREWRRIKHVAALRRAPDRLMLDSSTDLYPLGPAGEGLVRFLASSESTLAGLNATISTMGIPYEVGVTTSKLGPSGQDLGDVSILFLRDLQTGTALTLADVGVGISQVIPVLMQSLISSDTLLLMEQPELHLHPRLQAELADILIESTSRDNRLVIETHSEHLLTRIQRRIREGIISSSDVALYYVDNPEGGGARASRIHFTSHGEMIEPWPAGFFDEQFEDLFGGFGN